MDLIAAGKPLYTDEYQNMNISKALIISQIILFISDRISHENRILIIFPHYKMDQTEKMKSELTIITVEIYFALLNI